MEKSFFFFELQHGWRIVENYQNLLFVFKKNKQSFIDKEKDFQKLSAK